MQKINTLYFLALIAFLSACDNSDNDPKPFEKQLRADRIDFGDFAYRILHYNDENQVTGITQGLNVEGTPHEVHHDIIYTNGLVDKIKIQDEWEIRYVYDGARVSETEEYVQGTLFQVNVYLYDFDGRVKTWAIMRPNDEGQTVPIMKTTYSYNADDNLSVMKIFNYTEENSYELVSITEYQDFDDRKNPSKLFMTNLYNVYHKQFENNPRTWIVTNANGAVGTDTFRFEYNDQGYATKQIPETAGHTISYTFSEY